MSEELFERYLRDELDDDAARRLSAVLATEEGARRFAEFVQEWTLLGGAARQRLAEGDRQTSRRIRKVRVSAGSPGQTRAVLGWAIGAAAAAVFLLLVLSVPGRVSRREEKPPVVVRDAEAPTPAPAPPPSPVPDPAPPPAPRSEPRPAPPPTTPDPVVAPPPPPLPPPVEPPREKPAEPRGEPPTRAARVAIAVLGRVQGDVLVAAPDGRRKAAAGDSLSADDGVETRAGSALIEYPDGTRLDLSAETVVERLPEKQGRRAAVLARGTVTATVAKQGAGRSVVLSTPHAEVTVVGTVFAVAALPDATRVEVREGRVSIKRLPDGATVEVTAGHAAVAAKGQKLESRPVVFTRDFQDGPGYAGTRDTEISGADPARVFGAADVLEVDGDETEGKKLYGLIQWDLSELPPTAIVRSAVVTLDITNESQGAGYSFYELKRPWSEGDATWKIAAPGQPWRVPGARSPQDRGNEVLGTVAPRAKGTLKVLLLPAAEQVIQGWIRNPASNHGFILANDGNADGFKFHSRESAVPERRPRLTISYTLSPK